MNLKNLSLAAAISLTAGCAVKDPDQAFIDRLWNQTIKVTGIPRKTSKPEIVMLDEDLYRVILEKNCEFETEASKASCLTERKKLEDSVLLKTGKKYSAVYDWYMQIDRKTLEKNCEKSADVEKKMLCGKAKLYRPSSIKILGRTYLRNHYIEIFRTDINACIAYLPVSSAEKESFFYDVIAHEMLHAAMRIKKIDAIDHHRLMRDKYMEPMTDFISDYEKTGRNGFHRKNTFSSLELGIASDEKWKQDNQPKIRKKSGNPRTK